MPVIVTISNRAKLKKAQSLLGAKTESETLELALEKVITEYESQISDAPARQDLPDEFFEDLFAEKTKTLNGETIQAIIKEREESNR